MHKPDCKGITMVEILMVLIIIAILAAVAVPTVAHLVNAGKETSNENIARSLYVSVQSAVSDLKNNGNLSLLAQTDDDGRITGGYMRGDAGTYGRLPVNLSASDGANAANIYYAAFSRSGVGNKPLYDFLDGYVADKEILNDSISIEINIITGVVKAVFYGDTKRGDGARANFSFVYDGSEAEYDISVAKNRRTTASIGYYGVETTGTPAQIPVSLFVNLRDTGGGDMTAPDSLYAEALVPDLDYEYTMALTSRDGAPLTDKNGKPYAVTFKNDSSAAAVLAYDLAQAGGDPYTDLRASEHGGVKTRLVFRDAGRIVIPGNAVPYIRVFWVIDTVDAGVDGAPVLKNSIGVNYGDIRPDLPGIRVRLYKNEDDSEEALSNSESPYYDDRIGNAYMIRTARHFSNIRYSGVLTGASFIQNADIGFAAYGAFAPLTWTAKESGGFNTDGIFTHSYSAKKNNTASYVLSGLKLFNSENTPNFGLFSYVSGATIEGVTLVRCEIVSTSGGNVGAIAGKAENGAVIRLCASVSNVSVTDGFSSADTIAGGIAGFLADSEISLSYCGGFLKNNGVTAPSDEYGFVRVSGHDGFTRGVYIGGICGYVDLGGIISNSYNNARVNVDSQIYDDASARYLFTDPKATELSAAAGEVRTGGIAGFNAGTLTKVYGTNSVGGYGGASYCGMLAGENAGNITASHSLGGNLSALAGNGGALPASVTFCSKDIMSADLSALGFSTDIWFFSGGSYSSRGLPTADSFKPDDYPYPVLKNNLPINDWEDTHFSNETYVWMSAEDLSTPFGEPYKIVYIETAHTFYGYNTDKMSLTLTWDPAELRIDNSGGTAGGAAIKHNSDGTDGIAVQILCNGVYAVKFYAADFGSVAGLTVAAQCTIRSEKVFEDKK